MNIYFFRFYVLFFLTFLLIFAFFVSKQLFLFIFNNLMLIYLVYSFKKKDEENFNYFNLFDCYIVNGDIFSSICLCEFLLESSENLSQKDLIYTSLAYIYEQQSFYSIAEYYYFEAISLSNHKNHIFMKLNQMYSFLGLRKK